MGESAYALRQQRHGSVTERLAARLDEVEAIQARMLKNEAKLIADSVKAGAAIDTERTHRLLLADEQRSYVDARDRETWRYCRETRQRTDATLLEHIGRSLWGRLRWLVRGV